MINHTFFFDFFVPLQSLTQQTIAKILIKEKTIYIIISLQLGLGLVCVILYKLFIESEFLLTISLEDIFLI